MSKNLAGRWQSDLGKRLLTVLNDKKTIKDHLPELIQLEQYRMIEERYDLRWLTLEGKDLKEIDFSECNLDHALLCNTLFNWANMAGVSMRMATVKDCDFTGTIAIAGAFGKSKYSNCIFDTCDLNNADFHETVFKSCSFSKSTLNFTLCTKSKFVDCQFKECSFVSSNFSDSSWQKSRFQQGIFNQTILSDTLISECAFEGGHYEDLIIQRPGRLKGKNSMVREIFEMLISSGYTEC